MDGAIAPTFLHLSDLHLGTAEDEDSVGDFKSEIVPREQRLQRIDLLRNTLQRLGARIHADSGMLEGVIVSGDITYMCHEEGFEKLEEVLGWLGDAYPGKLKTVVVPGNHDVKWLSGGDASARYERFMKYVRAKGYVTPLLEGIDLKDDGTVSGDLSNHYLLAPDARWGVVPINSSHYCGSAESIAPISDTIWNELPKLIEGKLPKVTAEEIQKVLKRLRIFDVARISPPQLTAIRALSEAIRNQGARIGRKPLLIGVLHHQLLPVTIREEFKPYESITNLGHLRAVLRDNKFSIVLHGHKHVDSEYFDYIQKNDRAESEPHRVLVISAGSIKSADYLKSSACRLISIPDTTALCSATVTTVPLAPSGTGLEISKPRTIPVWQKNGDASYESSSTNLIEGNTINDVYDRALCCFESTDNTSSVSNLICRVLRAEAPIKLPANYPNIPGHTPQMRQNWFEQLVNWWQKNNFSRLTAQHHFNHGNRIYRYGDNINQLNAVAEALSTDPSTSRALVSLFNPITDKVQSGSRFPSFTLAQFVIRISSDCCYLEVLAFFRKQEMRYWWPINLAELARLQGVILQKMAGSTNSVLKKKPLHIGSITTVATIAHVGNEVPRILVPAVDFVFEEQPQKLWDMTYALCHEEIWRKSDYKNDWYQVLADLSPPAQRTSEEIPIPVQGLEYLTEISEHLARHHPESCLGKIAENWQLLVKRNRSFAGRWTSQCSDEAYLEWRREVLTILNSIRDLVDGAAPKEHK